MLRISRILLCLFLLLALAACGKPRANNINSVCSMFNQYPYWYWAAQKTAKRWWVPISVQMAIVHQESRFSATAKPPRTKLLWIIPWKRPTSAYGYTQALESTWRNYQKSVKRSAKRDGFEDAVDFIGWYAYQAYRKLGIPRNDAYKLYLAYHEGLGGYSRKTYLRKPWLIKVARKVKYRASIYQKQLNRCQRWLKEKPWYRFW